MKVVDELMALSKQDNVIDTGTLRGQWIRGLALSGQVMDVALDPLVRLTAIVVGLRWRKRTRSCWHMTPLMLGTNCGTHTVQ
jgi:hypothetical protein